MSPLRTVLLILPLAMARVSPAADVRFDLDIAAAKGPPASEVLRANVVAYLPQQISESMWSLFFKWQRVGDVVLETKWEVILPSSDFGDLKRRMQILDRRVLDVIGAGGRVQLIFQSVPRWLSTDPRNESKLLGNQNEKIWYSVPPNDYRQWQAVFREFVHHFNVELNTRGRVYYVIGNEPQNYWKGTQEEFFRFYEASARGAVEADPNVLIGGITPPNLEKNKFNTTGETSRSGQPTLYEWLQFCSAKRLPVGVITWHSPSRSPLPLETTLWDQEARQIRAWAERFGYGDAELILNDWPDWKANPDHDSEVKAAYVVTGIISILRHNLFRPVYLGLRDEKFDNQLAKANAGYGGGTGLMNKAGLIKPVFCAFALMSRMKGNILQVETNDPFVSAIASIEPGSRRVFLLASQFVPPDWLIERNLFSRNVNSDQLREAANSRGSAMPAAYVAGLRDFKDMARSRKNQDATLRVGVMNLSPGEWAMEVFTIDGDHSNLFARRGEIQSRLLPSVRAKDLRGIEPLVLQFNEQSLPEVSDRETFAVGDEPARLNVRMPPNSVKLIVLTKR